jgi:hypothetical protein
MLMVLHGSDAAESMHVSARSRREALRKSYALRELPGRICGTHAGPAYTGCLIDGRARATGGRPACREVLLVIEGDDLRTSLSLEVALEIGRDVNCRDGIPRSYCPRGRCEVAGAWNHTETGRRRHLLDKGAGGF